MSYEAFLESKLQAAPLHGLLGPSPIHSTLFDWQSEISQWALERGRAAIWADCGLGKTLMQLEWARHIPGRVLILAPLAVTHQTVREAAKLDMEVKYLREDDPSERIVVTNYEMLDHFDSDRFEGVVLDESSILKNFTGATKRKILQAFETTRFRLACTATPAPNDHMELGNHAAFLGSMAANEMLARWFINDSMRAGAYRLKKHAASDFWRWVSSWAVALRRPSDLGNYDDEGFVLPALTAEVVGLADLERATERGHLFLDGSVSATELWGDKAETAVVRCEAAAKIAAEEPDEAWVFWCETNQEADLLKKLIPEAVEVRGSDKPEDKARKLDEFSSGKAQSIITKPGLAGFGLNWQHSARCVYVGLTYSFERIYQSMHRLYRFGQEREVKVWLITAESEGGILRSFERKRKAYEEMSESMVEATRVHGLGNSDPRLLTVSPQTEMSGEDWKLIVGDCVAGSKDLPDDSVDLSVFSPPFSNLYIYSDSVADMGNSANHAEFFTHLDYLIEEVLRITKPGRLVCVHCKDLPLYMNRDGAFGLYDFPGELVRHFEGKGWTFHSRVTIWKDPVTEMQRTKNHGLLHKNFADRAEVTRQGMADYVLVFRAWKGEIPDKQIANRPIPGEFIGEQSPTDWEDQRDYSIQVWQRYASPVWFDVRQSRVLQYRDARDPSDERHICPLQLDVIERCIWLWSNEGETVFDPFAGIGSTGVVALQIGRKFLGIELKEGYAKAAARHLEDAVMAKAQGTLL